MTNTPADKARRQAARQRKRAEQRAAAEVAPGGASAAASGPASGRAPDVQQAVRPVAGPSRVRRRHRGLAVSFFVMVVLPVVLAIFYMSFMARDQFGSTVGFTVRSEETGSAAELVGGLSSLVAGGASQSDTDVLFAFIQSQAMVERVQSQLDFAGHYQQDWLGDPLYSLWPDATIEDITWFWQRMVRVSYDKASGLMDVLVLARTPEFAQELAQLVVRESERMINALNEQVRRDTTANAVADVQTALERLRRTREDLAAFRARTQIVDPQADIQGRMGVINNLQQQLAEALVDYDLLLQTTTEGDPRVRQATRRIEVIQTRIDEERRNFATRDVTVLDTDYPRLIAQFESLMVNQEFAERTYTAALTALDAARSNAQRQSLYLATYIQPTLAQRAEYPQRIVLTLLVAFFSLMTWAAAILVYYSLRDRG